METSVCQSGTDYFLSSTEKHIDGTSGSVIVVPTECACVCQQKSLQFFNIFFSPLISVNGEGCSQPATDPDPLPGACLSIANPVRSQLPPWEG